jgi:flagellar assembly factor FliW
MIKSQSRPGDRRFEELQDEGVADPEHSVEFPDGLPGFESCRHFSVVSPDAIAPFELMHAIDGPPVAFVTIDPSVVMPDYRRAVRHRDRVRVGAADDESLIWRAMVTIDDDGAAWVNLRAPIVVNPVSMIGCQIVPRDAVYPLRHPLALGR